MKSPSFRAAFCFALLSSTALSPAQLRIATWNVSNYGGGRDTDIKNVVYATFNGRSMSPDIIMVQEFLSQAATTNFLNDLNTAPGSPGDWAAAPFILGPDTQSEFFYRTSKVNFLNVTVVSTGGPSPNQPRNIQRYDIRPQGYSGAASTLASYVTHMKAGTTSDDLARRLTEATRIRTDAQGLPAGWHFLLGGDYNIRSSNESAYQYLITSQQNNAGRLWDPINSAGSWNGNANFKYIHTQDPSTTSGMDDRYDQILLSGSLIDGRGFDYIGNANVPYSTNSWNDPNHSYRAWGNDGTSFQQMLTTTGNTMVGATIAQSIINTSTTSGGHIPVFLDMKVPPKADASGVMNFGQVTVNSIAQETLTVTNIGDTNLWTAAGINALHYSLNASQGFTAPSGNFLAAPGGAGNNHTITMDTSTPGRKSGTVTINSDDPDSPALVIPYTGDVVEQILPNSFTLARGIVISGGLSELFLSDDQRLTLRPGIVLSSSEAPIQLILDGTTSVQQPGLLVFKIESAANQPNLNQTVSLFNYSTNAYDELDSRAVTLTDSTATVTLTSNAVEYVSAGQLRAKISYRPVGPILAYPWQIRIDQTIWLAEP